MQVQSLKHDTETINPYDAHLTKPIESKTQNTLATENESALESTVLSRTAYNLSKTSNQKEQSALPSSKIPRLCKLHQDKKILEQTVKAPFRILSNLYQNHRKSRSISFPKEYFEKSTEKCELSKLSESSKRQDGTVLPIFSKLSARTYKTVEEFIVNNDRSQLYEVEIIRKREKEGIYSKTVKKDLEKVRCLVRDRKEMIEGIKKIVKKTQSKAVNDKATAECIKTESVFDTTTASQEKPKSVDKPAQHNFQTPKKSLPLNTFSIAKEILQTHNAPHRTNPNSHWKQFKSFDSTTQQAKTNTTFTNTIHNDNSTNDRQFQCRLHRIAIDVSRILTKTHHI